MSNQEAVKKLLALLGVYKKTIAVIIGCLLVSTALNLCIPLLSRRIMDDGFIGSDKDLLVVLAFCSFLIYLISSGIDLLKEKKRVDIAAKLQYTLAEESYAHLVRMRVGYFTRHNYGEIMNNIREDVGNMASIADESTFFVVTQIFGITGGIIGLLIIDWRMTLLVLLFIPVKYVITHYFARRRKRSVDDYISSSQKYASWFGDTVGGLREIKLFGIAQEKHKEFDEKQGKVICSLKELNMLLQWNDIADVVLVQFLTTLIYIVGSNMVFALHLSIGSVFAFITYSTYVTRPISAILNIGYLLSGIIPSTKRYYEFMEEEEEEEEDQGAEYRVVPQPGEIEFRQVSFAYEKDKPVLENVSFLIPRGSKTALVGKNGSGKSTVIDLLLRLYEPGQGQILLNGQEISGMPLMEYRNLISVVSQDIYLFQDTIRNNICLYVQMEDAQILEACRDSGLAEFIKEVSLDYPVGTNGMMLSGGQKQKIALARALVHDRPIVVFDEATSSSDACSEQQINALLHTRLRDKTVIVIAHRQAVLSKVDQVVRLDSGTEASQEMP